MLKLVEEHGTRYWALIGAKLNGRTGKQVRNIGVLRGQIHVGKFKYSHEGQIFS